MKSTNQNCGIQINQVIKEYLKVYMLRQEKNKNSTLVKPPL